jgi:hypothetical protein
LKYVGIDCLDFFECFAKMNASTSAARDRTELEVSPHTRENAQASTSAATSPNNSAEKGKGDIVLEISDGGKGDLKKRRRMRYYILCKQLSLSASLCFTLA